MSTENCAKCFTDTSPFILSLKLSMIWCYHDIHSIEEETKVRNCLCKNPLASTLEDSTLNPGQCGLALCCTACLVQPAWNNGISYEVCIILSVTWLVLARSFHINDFHTESILAELGFLSCPSTFIYRTYFGMFPWYPDLQSTVTIIQGLAQ